MADFICRYLNHPCAAAAARPTAPAHRGTYRYTASSQSTTVRRCEGHAILLMGVTYLPTTTEYLAQSRFERHQASAHVWGPYFPSVKGGCIQERLARISGRSPGTARFSPPSASSR